MSTTEHMMGSRSHRMIEGIELAGEKSPAPVIALRLIGARRYLRGLWLYERFRRALGNSGR